MASRLRSIGLRYVLPLGLFVLILAFADSLFRLFSWRFDPSTLIIALMIASAWYFGRGPGLFVALLYEVAIEYYAFKGGAPMSWRYGIIIFNRLALFVALALFASSRRRAEREREHLLRREQAARSEAEEANRLKDEFLATVSHELRTPLNAILGWASLLSRHTLDDQTMQMAASVIERNARGQAEIINDILDVSRIVSSKLRIEAQLIELVPIIQMAMDTVHPAAAAKSISMVSTLSPQAGTVLGDPDRLQQVIANLLSNAIKFTPSGGRIDVSLARVGAHVEIKVSDSGIGIDPQFLPYVFDRFRQADSSTTRAHSGLGLGLSIVRHLVELHGGAVAAHSRGQGRGADFTVRLPLSEAPELTPRPGTVDFTEVEQSAAVGEMARPTIDLGGLRVLVVDDDADTRDVLCLALGRHGAEVRSSASSADALGTFRQWQPDVLISDLGMPGEDGFALIETVRQLAPEAGGNVPAAALTAYARDEDSARARAAGYQVHLSKPVDPGRLMRVVAGLARRASKA